MKRVNSSGKDLNILRKNSYINKYLEKQGTEVISEKPSDISWDESSNESKSGKCFIYTIFFLAASVRKSRKSGKDLSSFANNAISSQNIELPRRSDSAYDIFNIPRSKKVVVAS